ncbi:hypothetical protein BD410DRAFT_782301 [Rickenella mellea]|uniref:Uncharacterized protein n=1 Tax=Rickenella mellea TaxID=50990 RepID=A0A4Y7QIP6_9AGAM|nr:hypothetical protein BD410DRAFT_782301 [Rickenella mellea]
MPRRPPPTSLRLAQGPTPTRGQPKHTLPSIPRPTFYPSKLSGTYYPRVTEPLGVAPPTLPVTRSPPDGYLPLYCSVSLPGSRRNSSSGEGEGGHDLQRSAGAEPKKTTRGPWDHSGSISLPINVESILTLPKPVAISP